MLFLEAFYALYKMKKNELQFILFINTNFNLL